ncbi:ABC transporter ATP-binding protein [Gordonia sp. NB41Y]|uniref:energy-coupling factor ABC transporter ATP-binding protein n=1 Tax=Gordonia sp. NB41Y TaxID=875808 RepID=UPI0002BFED30|nr:ABC transporter ATP-binding protein [Gordonia sp. NB41Y]EMP11436.1 cobalt ABC transporter ATP-binding protein [Gordonia sp. NB41Y]WLP91578.1 ABC transporter ATP-binding protein [Gordonia sp. NB41Y]
MIEFRDVTHAYDARTVLREVSLTLSERRVGIVGANGSGKSTLARMINALVTPDQGSVVVDGVDASRHKRQVRRSVGFVFSDPDRQIIMPTVREDIELSLTRTELNRAQRAERTRAVLDRFGLADHADHPSARLSGGQKQLLALASILVTEPQIIVADEPTTLLDLRNSRMLREVFAGLDEQLIVVTHDLDLVDDFDRVLVIDDGRVVVDDLPGPALTAYRAMMS